MNTLIALDKDVAEGLFGWKSGRPTISRRVGGMIARATGMSAEAGTDLFHLALVIGAVVWVAPKLK